MKVKVCIIIVKRMGARSAMIEAILEYQFMQNAVIAIILASIVCGIIGVVIIVEKKMVMLSGGIAHTSYGSGVGLGYLMGSSNL